MVTRNADTGGGAHRPDVVVVGGGLVGLSSAYYLRKAGATVTVLERGKVGGGASRFNAGEVTTHVSPLPGPGVIGDAVRTVFRADGPIRVAPSQLLRAAGFFGRFLRNCTGATYDARTAALISLNRPTFRLYDELAAAGLVTDMRSAGYLVCAGSRAEVEESHHHYLEAPYEGSRPGPILESADLRTLEPALSDKAPCGFLQPDERWIDPSPFVDRMSAALRDQGVDVVEDAGVSAIKVEGARMKVHSAAGEFTAGTVVVSAGVWSNELCRSLGVPLGMQPGKGYSFTVKTEVMPSHLLYFADALAVATPVEGRLRIAGTMEFDGTREMLNHRRIQAMVTAVRDFLPHADWENLEERWVAPRPMTADGLPLIGRLRKTPGVVVATGHNMLGLTLGPATGSVVADLVLDRDPGIDLAPFDPHRFA